VLEQSLQFRKHVAWYLQTRADGKPFRKEFNYIDSTKQQLDAIKQFFERVTIKVLKLKGRENSRPRIRVTVLQKAILLKFFAQCAAVQAEQCRCFGLIITGVFQHLFKKWCFNF
jgi:hypothetical protein